MRGSCYVVGACCRRQKRVLKRPYSQGDHHCALNNWAASCRKARSAIDRIERQIIMLVATRALTEAEDGNRASIILR